MLQPRCLKCTGAHLTRNCPPESAIKCVNCKKGYLANSEICEKYIQKTIQIQQRRSGINNNNINNINNQRQYIPAPLPPFNAWTVRPSHHSSKTASDPRLHQNFAEQPYRQQQTPLRERPNHLQPRKNEWPEFPPIQPSRQSQQSLRQPAHIPSTSHIPYEQIINQNNNENNNTNNVNNITSLFTELKNLNTLVNLEGM